MFDDVPVRIWILLFIATVAWVPARYIFRHVAHSPSRRDITLPPDDLSWRSQNAFVRSVAILAGLAALGVFIFTDAAAAFAQSPSFLPILMLGLGFFAFWSVAKGLLTGTVEPMLRGANWAFNRQEQPKRFWASMVWNATVGGFVLFFSGQTLIEAPTEALHERCYDRKDMLSPKDELAACNQLLTGIGVDGKSGVLAARGTVFYQLGDYHRAGDNYAAAIRLDPEDSSSHYNLGLVHEHFNDHKHAIADYEAAIRIDPKNADAHSRRGLIFLNRGRFKEAIVDFTHAQELQPANAFHVANRGMAYAWRYDAVQAEQDFANIRNADPAYPIVLHGKALLAIDRKDISGGARLLSDAIARDPNDAWALGMRADLYRRTGEAEKMRADVATLQQLNRTKN